mmetsp:Transcript_4184/g.11540  ORF Transcript_4184/g.11540 Transcript_4184/m.11540 type:complete len:96 (+) Transcript_4184:3889-4176(+)
MGLGLIMLRSNAEGVAGAAVGAPLRAMQEQVQEVVVDRTRRGKERAVTGAGAGVGAGDAADEGNEAARIVIGKNHRNGVAGVGVGQRGTKRPQVN